MFISNHHNDEQLGLAGMKLIARNLPRHSVQMFSGRKLKPGI